MQEIILEIENINKCFELPRGGLFDEKKYRNAVSGVSLSLRKGEILGIAGESGSGKSTMAGIIVRLIKEDSGKIIFKGKDITQTNTAGLKEYRRNVQMVFQNTYTSLNPSKKIGWLMKEALDINTDLTEEEKHKLVIKTADMAGLRQKHLERLPKELSGGERQRAAIGIALMLKPEIIVLDEAVSALDVSVQAQVLNLLRELKDELSLSYIFISHDLNVINYLCDTIGVMHEGKLIEYGKAEDVFSNPKEEYTKKLFNAIRPVKYI